MRILPILLTAMIAFASATVEPSTDSVMMAKLLWGECRGVESKMEQAAVAWCVLNRVDDPRFPGTIQEVITQPYQFTGYQKSNPVDPELLELAQDVIERWQNEDEGRVLPEEYVYFVAGGGHNRFSKVWPVGREVWDWSLEDPYMKGEEDVNTFEDVDGHDAPGASHRYRDGILYPGNNGPDDDLVVGW